MDDGGKSGAQEGIFFPALPGFVWVPICGLTSTIRWPTP